MMDFKEFTQRAEQDIRAALEDASPGTRVDVNQVEKLQGESYTAVTLTPDATNMGMNLNLNQLYDRMQRGDSYEHVIRGALDQAKEQLGHMPRFNVSEISSYENAKELLFVDVVGIRVNAEMLAKVPHTDMEDLSMVYRMQLEQLSDGAATVLITNDLMERMGVTKEQLHADALANSERIRPANMRTMAEVLSEMMGYPGGELSDGDGRSAALCGQQRGQLPRRCRGLLSGFYGSGCKGNRQQLLHSPQLRA